MATNAPPRTPEPTRHNPPPLTDTLMQGGILRRGRVLPAFADRARALIEEAWRRARRRRAMLGAASLAVAVLFVAAVLTLGQPTEPAPSADEPAGHDPRQASAWNGVNGTVAAMGAPKDGRTSDIYLVGPGTTAPKRLTSTPELDEYAPSWSPDGTRLAFIRSSWGFHGCAARCELVLVDTATREQSSVDLDSWPMVPTSIAWAPDGQSVVIPTAACGIGGCGGRDGSIFVDTTSGRAVETPPGVNFEAWSPDGRWLTLVDGGREDRPSVVLVPAAQVTGTSFTDPAWRKNWTVISADSDYGIDLDWAPDSSAIIIAESIWAEPGHKATIDVVTVPDSRRRTTVADGAGPIVSPDGRRIAYVTGYQTNSPEGHVLTDTWVSDIDGTDAYLVARHAAVDAWSPDGRLILAHDDRSWFTIDTDGAHRSDLAVRTADGHLPWGSTASWQRRPAESAATR